MSHPSRTLGVTRVDSRLLAAVVSNDGARLSVRKLIEAEDGVNQKGLDQGDFSDGRLFFSVSPDIAIVKKIRLESAPMADLSDMVRFEMSQSLLEPPESFYFDSLPFAEENGKHQTYLSIAYHRSQIDALMDEYKKKLAQPSGFKLDAVALVDGYLAFCHRDPGELEAILDFSPNRVAIAFIYRDQLFAVASVQFQNAGEASEQSWGQLSSEIKMTLDYQLSRFFEQGITIPLSRIIISGELANHPPLRAALKSCLSTPVGRPRFHDGYFQTLGEKPEHPERFLIPLGLAVV